jgi:hypothetical protein
MLFHFQSMSVSAFPGLQSEVRALASAGRISFGVVSKSAFTSEPGPNKYLNVLSGPGFQQR